MLPRRPSLRPCFLPHPVSWLFRRHSNTENASLASRVEVERREKHAFLLFPRSFVCRVVSSECRQIDKNTLLETRRVRPPPSARCLILFPSSSLTYIYDTHTHSPLPSSLSSWCPFLFFEWSVRCDYLRILYWKKKQQNQFSLGNLFAFIFRRFFIKVPSLSIN